jgi:bacteriocin leader peptide (microcyclamide/patellamide family)
MNNKSITPNPQQPVDRVPTGQLPSALAELSEATLGESAAISISSAAETGGVEWDIDYEFYGLCSYSGDDAD